MEDKTPLSRAELLSGELNRSRRAARLLSAIETRCQYMRDESRKVVATFLLEGSLDFKRSFDGDYVKTLKLEASGRDLLQPDHLERFASQWRFLVPSDPELRARIIRLMGQKYGLTPALTPRTFAALGVTDEDVQAVYRRLFDEPLDGFGSVNLQEPASSGHRRTEIFEDVETRLEWLNLASGETLFCQGDPGDALYVLISGRLVVLTAGDDGREQQVGEIGRGEMIGELAVLKGDTRSATVRAVRDSELVCIAREELLALAQRHMQVMLQINDLIARRLRKQNTGLTHPESALTTLALLPCEAGVPLQDFGRQLTDALGQFGPAIYVNQNLLENVFEPGAAQTSPEDRRNAEIVSWLNELESRYKYVVYEGEPAVSQWSRRCIRQADRILLIGRAGASPEPVAYETALLAGEIRAHTTGQQDQPERQAAEHGSRIELVLLHNAGAATASKTAAWLAARSLREHYHVQVGNHADVSRLARRLTGHAYGLVLGGGGARGFAHVGVFQALEEAGMQVDIVAGTSMGAIVAGGIGMCMSAVEMRGIARQLSSPSKIYDPTLPVVSLFSGAKTTHALQKIYGETLIEDLWRPMFCVSTNVTRANAVIHREGPLWEAIRASMSLPGIFPPVLYRGDLLVDGGVMNNLPIDIMRQFVQGGCVVAVNVSPPEDLMKEYHYGPSISGARALLSKLNRHDSISVPLIHECLTRIMVLHDVNRRTSKQQLADIFISPQVQQYGLLDFGAYAPIIEIGYNTAKEVLEKEGAKKLHFQAT